MEISTATAPEHTHHTEQRNSSKCILPDSVETESVDRRIAASELKISLFRCVIVMPLNGNTDHRIATCEAAAWRASAHTCRREPLLRQILVLSCCANRTLTKFIVCQSVMWCWRVGSPCLLSIASQIELLSNVISAVRRHKLVQLNGLSRNVIAT